MRILQITAGAAGMYCGSCLRDNALAAELIRQGHDITLIPLYTPTLTDEANVSSDHIFFGGISVYLEQHSALFRHTPWIVDKLWDSRFALKAAARSSIPTNPKLLGELTVSMLRGEDGHQRKELGKLIRWLRSQPAPDVVVLPNSMLIGLAAPIKRALNLPICCTLQGEDLFLEGLAEPYRSTSLDLIRRNIEHVDLFLPTSDYYAEFMSRYLKIAPDRIHTVPLGIMLDGYERIPRPANRAFTVGYFARVAPEKGLHILAETYREFRQLYKSPARLEAAGYMAAEHKPYLASIERQLQEWGLGGEFKYRGTLDRDGKIGFLQQLDVLSAPGDYADPKGIYALEGMACGVPFVQPDHGAFTEIVRATNAGLLAAPGNVPALAAALHAVATDQQLLGRLSDNAYNGVRQHYAVSSMAAHALEAYKRCLSPKTSKSSSTPQEVRSRSSITST
jgi:glycosyltransferase involved in cell wall biosynthesis